MPRLPIPTVHEVLMVPARGALALLDCAIDVCAIELEATHRHEFSEVPCDPQDHDGALGGEVLAARAILCLARDLRTLLRVYEREVHALEEPDRDSPYDHDPDNQDIPY